MKLQSLEGFANLAFPYFVDLKEITEVSEVTGVVCIKVTNLLVLKNAGKVLTG
jgi:hypothetical protein